MVTAAKKTAAPKPPAKKAAAPKPAPKPTFADYGYVKAFLDKHPDVKAKLDLAIKQGWTPARLEGEVRTTKWYTTRTDSQRKWDLLSTEQPTEAKRQIDAKKAEVNAVASRMGVTLDDAQLDYYAKFSIRDGKSEAELMASLADRVELAPEGTAQQGDASSVVDSIRQSASDYGVTITDANLLAWTRGSLAGTIDPKALEDTFRESAKALYPPLADILDKGQTVKGFVSPYLDIASKQLGLMPDQMDLTDSKWTGMISGGAVLSADEWTKKLRTDSTYGWNQTEGAKREAMSFVSTLGSIFGGA